MKLRIDRQMIRFGSIGVLNTLIDLILFHILISQFGFHFYIANVISTAAALCFSFLLNAKYTFYSTLTKRNALLFVIVTLTGLWLLQPLVITLTHPILALLFTSLLSNDLMLLGAKIVATGFSLVWNYAWYKYVVFPSKKIQ